MLKSRVFMTPQRKPWNCPTFALPIGCHDNLQSRALIAKVSASDDWLAKHVTEVYRGS
jgi:hypothetical protein